MSDEEHDGAHIAGLVEHVADPAVAEIVGGEVLGEARARGGLVDRPSVVVRPEDRPLGQAELRGDVLERRERELRDRDLAREAGLVVTRLDNDEGLPRLPVLGHTELVERSRTEACLVRDDEARPDREASPAARPAPDR